MSRDSSGQRPSDAETTDERTDDPDRIPTVDCVLVPVDGSEESTRAVEYAVAIAQQYDATLEVVHVLGEEVVRALEGGELDKDDVAEDTRTYLETAEGIAADYDVPVNTMTAYGFSTERKTQHPGSVILDIADETDADFIVIPREPQTDAPNVLEKAAEYTLLYASQPVLSV